MISTYLRLDLYKKVNKEKFFKYIDSRDLSLGEEILSILEGYLEFHYAELALCSGPTWRSGKEMPEYFVNRAEERLGLLKGKAILVIGVSYKANVADTRETPAASIIDLLRQAGATVIWHDPLVGSWRGEKNSDLVRQDVAVVVTKHDAVSVSDIKKSSYVFDCTGSVAGVDGV